MGAFLFLFLIFQIPHAWGQSDPDPWQGLRSNMVQEILEDVKWTSKHTGKKEFDSKVIIAMEKVPRHQFVPENIKSHAYENRPLPIGYGQTISQPYIVALMTDLLELKPGDRALEIGTGSGYQAAVLSELIKEVYTIEIIPQLGKQAHDRLKKLGYKNIQTKIGDGYYGWKEKGPFDAIVVTAAATHIPPDLLKQLKPGGKLVIPLGAPFSTQQLILVKKDQKGNYKTRQILPVQFVPFKRN